MTVNSKNRKHLQSLKTNREKAAFLAGGKVTVGKLMTVEDRKLISYYVPRIRGLFVGDGNMVKHKTPEEARNAGKEIMEFWKEERNWTPLKEGDG